MENNSGIMYFYRLLENKILSEFFKGRAIFILGPRRSGKTTLMKKLIERTGKDFLWFSGDKLDDVEILTPRSDKYLLRLIQNASIVAIDEAHFFNDIARTIKIFTDYIADVQVIATGSSAFEIVNKMQETLTGRKWEYYLMPLSFEELVNATSLAEQLRDIDNRVVYGFYPEVVLHPGKEREILAELQSTYIYKDVFVWANIKKSDKLYSLVKAIAYQVGSVVSLNELSRMLKISVETVERYLDILERAFIIFRLGSYKTNLRSELKRSRKIYFWDTGIRNSVINDFRPLAIRQDKGQLWENFIVSEFMKKNFNKLENKTFYFWRTKQGQEVDLLEVKDAYLRAFEIKYSGEKARISKTFMQNYPYAEAFVIDKNNFFDFLLD